jgi:predicted translin family RNA/ssDNA-binding protein
MQSPETEHKLPGNRHEEALKNLTEAHRLLDSLRSEIESHPNLEAAIVKLELALENLTINTGGML